jgi:hypothetical protein
MATRVDIQAYVASMQTRANYCRGNKSDQKVYEKCKPLRESPYWDGRLDYLWADRSVSRWPSLFSYTDNSIRILSPETKITTNISEEPKNETPKTQKSEEEVKAEAQKRKENWAIAIGVTAVIAGAGLFGWMASRLRDSHASLQKTKIQFEGVFVHDERLVTFVNHAQIVDETFISAERKYLATALGMMVGGALLAAGGLGSSPFQMTAGAVAATASVAFGTFSIAYHWKDQERLESSYKYIFNEGYALLNRKGWKEVAQAEPSAPEMDFTEPLYPLI